MKKLLCLIMCLVIAATPVAALMGCATLSNLLGGTSVTPADASAAQVDAADIVLGLDKAWNIAVPLCLNAEQTGALPAGTCAKALLPAEQSIKLAANLVDLWDDASREQLGCLVAQVTQAMVSTTNLMQTAGVTIPPQVGTAEAIAESLAGPCPADAGAGG